ncbi:nuclease-related domain-containing protein [Pseudanabaena mucicola]|uniref:NERD domain-containing protein n=1 Tax=Pseudanabaena mucicola FACHB-723 TaxID=2692860 RepID=A0ABR7ZYR8_9CYAN|nr:nuclease-related domain-containing protein [Pseudanabaena mucicola]MBD2189077.1 NERD domain-containing protein [Pseudanabaena mucicola FACHB-723]
MVIKELDSIESTNKLEQAGYCAESQLAFYLKREFKDDPQFLIFNNLRFKKDEDVCQIDHLILYQYGIVIIESKSVTTRVEVNELGEWKRWFNNDWQGMPSPIFQAQRQGKFLKDYLEDHVESLLNKMLFGMQSHFTKMPIDVLVAISDSGIINRPANDKLDIVCKADQVPEKIKAIASEYRKKSSLFNLSLETAYELNKEEISKISKFLLAHHQPVKNKPLVDSPMQNIAIATPQSPPPKKIIPTSSRRLPKPDPPPKPVAKPVAITTKNTCTHCQSPNIAIAYVHSYFFKCNACGKNTPIKNTCPTCCDRERIRKSGLQFFSECEKCKTSRLFHINSID